VAVRWRYITEPAWLLSWELSKIPTKAETKRYLAHGGGGMDINERSQQTGEELVKDLSSVTLGKNQCQTEKRKPAVGLT